MANIVKHRFASAKANGPDATQVQPSHWNDGHAFSGGNAGDVLTRDPTDATYGAKWAAPANPTALGLWQPEPFNAASFIPPAGMTWSVTAGNINANRYTVIGKTLHWIFWIDSTTISGTMSSEVQIRIPGGYLAASAGHAPAFWGFVPNAPTPTIELTAYWPLNANIVNIKTFLATNLVAGPFYLRGQMTIEIQ